MKADQVMGLAYLELSLNQTAQQEQDTPDQVISNLMYSLFESPTGEMCQQAINTVGLHSNKMPELKDFITSTKKLILEYTNIVQAPCLYSPI